MQKIKTEIDKVVENYFINKKYLRQLIKSYYPEGSRMDYYITDEKFLRPLEEKIKKKLYEEHGIPHLIFDDLVKYMSDDVVKEGYLYE